MGWSDIGDGCLDGDAPADAVAVALDRIAEEGRRRNGRLPSGEAVLCAVVHALNLDGSRAPFYSEPRRIASVFVPHRSRWVRLDGSNAEPWIVAELYATFEEVAEAYLEAWDRPPHLSELVHYLGYHLEEAEVFPTRVSDGAPWGVTNARFVYRKERKPPDRAPAPEAGLLPVQGCGRVRHPKFGEGVVVGQDGDRLTVLFGSERRVVLRSFVSTLAD